MKISEIAWRNITRNIRRSILSGSAIAVATFSIVFLFALIAGIKDDMGYNLSTYVTGNVRIRHQDFDKYEHLNPLHLNVPDYESFAADVAALEGIEGVAPRINFPAMIKKNDPKVELRALSLDSTNKAFSSIQGKYPSEGKKEALVDTAFASQYDMKEGDLIDFATRRSTGGIEKFMVEVTGFADFGDAAQDGEVIAIPEGVLSRVQFESGNTFRAKVAIVQDGTGGLGMSGDIQNEKEFQKLEEVLNEGSALPTPGKREVVLGAGLAAELKVGIGDKVTVLTSTPTGSNSMTFTVTGTAVFPYGALTSTYFVLPIDQAQNLLKMPGSATEILIKTGLDVDTEAVAAEVQKIIDAKAIESAEAKSWTKIPTIYSMLGLAEAIYGVFAMIFFILASSVIVNTTMMVIFERIKEIGTVSAMGMTGKEIVKLFFLEAAYIGIIGAFVGAILAVVGLLPMHLRMFGIDFTEAMQGMDFEIGGIMYPRIDGLTVLFIFVYSSIVAALTTLIPTRRAAKINPVDALRGNN